MLRLVLEDEKAEAFLTINRRKNNTAKIPVRDHEVDPKPTSGHLRIMNNAKLSFKAHLDYEREGTNSSRPLATLILNNRRVKCSCRLLTRGLVKSNLLNAANVALDLYIAPEK